MGINFPNAPTVGQLWPQPPVAGQSVYQWDGSRWGSSSSVATTGAVRYDVAQTLTTDTPPSTIGQRTQARSNVYAAPFDALAYHGMQINGGMALSQELGATYVSASNALKYAIDGWMINTSGAQVMSAGHNAAAPPGYLYSLQAYASTANASPLAGDYCLLQHYIEGYRISRLAWGTASASPITIAFWVFSDTAGLFSGVVTGGGGSNYSYVFTFTVNTAATWQYVTITIPGPTVGTWKTDNTMGLTLCFALMCGSTYSTASTGAWLSGLFLAANGSTNMISTVNRTFLITGVTVLPGLEAPSVVRAPFIMRSVDQEVSLCQRYFARFDLAASSLMFDSYAAVAGQNAIVPGSYPVSMRAIPTFTSIGTFTGSNASTFTPSYLGSNSYFQLSWNAAAVGRFWVSVPSGGAVFLFNARL